MYTWSLPWYRIFWEYQEPCGGTIPHFHCRDSHFRITRCLQCDIFLSRSSKNQYLSGLPLLCETCVREPISPDWHSVPNVKKKKKLSAFLQQWFRAFALEIGTYSPEKQCRPNQMPHTTPDLGLHCFGLHALSLIQQTLDASRESNDKKQHDMCVQRRLRSAWASA